MPKFKVIENFDNAVHAARNIGQDIPTAEQQHTLIQQARINGLLHVKFLANS